MSVRVVGAWCIECGMRPALSHGICSACDRLTRTFGPRGVERIPVLSVSDPGFEEELRRWREGS
jgi:hypothetical protein